MLKACLAFPSFHFAPLYVLLDRSLLAPPKQGNESQGHYRDTLAEWGRRALSSAWERWVRRAIGDKACSNTHEGRNSPQLLMPPASGQLTTAAASPPAACRAWLAS